MTFSRTPPSALKALALGLTLTATLFAQSDSRTAGPYPTLIVRNVTLIDGTGSPARGPVDIIIRRNVIEQVVAADEITLANGKTTTYQVILDQRDLTAARGNEIQALDSYNKDLAQLSLDEGSTLERLDIDFRVK